MSEYENYEVLLYFSQHKSKLLREELSIHTTCYRRLDAVLRRYYHLENGHAQQLALLIPELDSIGLYRQVTGKLASFLDTTVFQTQHMLEELKELLSNYQRTFSEAEAKLTEQLKEFSKRKQETNECLQQLCKSLMKKAEPAKQTLEGYGYSLQKYCQSNETLLGYRPQFHSSLFRQVNDEITRFFVLQLERLRNNQFDIDQILKKAPPEELKLIELQQQVQWKPLQGGELTLGPREDASLEVIAAAAKDVDSHTPELLCGVFNEHSFDESITQLPGLLSSPEFQQQTRKLLVCFSTRSVCLSQRNFQRVLQFATVLFEHAIGSLKVQLLGDVLLFASAVCTKLAVCEEKGMNLYESVTIFDELRKHEGQRQEYWAGVCEQITQSFEGDEREDRLQRYRKCLRKLGVSMLEQIKPKKRIFSKVGGKPE